MPILKCRFFFDTSVVIAALLSPKGAAGELMRLVEAEVVTMVVSETVIREADGVLSTKFPELAQEGRGLWKHLHPEIAPTPTAAQLKPFAKKLPTGNAMILCAAQSVKVSAFVTWNTRDFMAPGISSLAAFPIVVPGQALKLFRAWMDPLIQ